MSFSHNSSYYKTVSAVFNLLVVVTNILWTSKALLIVSESLQVLNYKLLQKQNADDFGFQIKCPELCLVNFVTWLCRELAVGAVNYLRTTLKSVVGRLWRYDDKKPWRCRESCGIITPSQSKRNLVNEGSTEFQCVWFVKTWLWFSFAMKLKLVKLVWIYQLNKQIILCLLYLMCQSVLLFHWK